VDIVLLIAGILAGAFAFSFGLAGFVSLPDLDAPESKREQLFHLMDGIFLCGAI